MRRSSSRILPLVPLVSLLFVVALLPFALGFVPLVRFTSERIDVHVYPEEIMVCGSYFYKNPFPFPVLQGFTVPFPVDRDHPEPVEVAVEHLTRGKGAIPMRRSFGSRGFEVFFAAHEEKVIGVSYRQKVRVANATYILTTTRPWGRLASGVYRIYPHGTVVLSSNYALDLPGGLPGFRRDGFLPDRDWHFTWRRAHEETL